MYFKKHTDTDNSNNYVYDPTNTKPYACNKCNKRFTKKGKNLQKHIENCKFNGKGFTCDICLKIFKTEKLLKSHQRKFHKLELEDKIVICEFCFAKTFKNKGKHYKTHIKKCQEDIKGNYSDDDKDIDMNTNKLIVEKYKPVLDKLSDNEEYYNSEEDVTSCKFKGLKCKFELLEDNYTSACINCGYILSTFNPVPESDDEDTKNFSRNAYNDIEYHKKLWNKLRGIDCKNNEICMSHDFIMDILVQLNNKSTWKDVYNAFNKYKIYGFEDWWLQANKIFDIDIPQLDGEIYVWVQGALQYYKKRGVKVNYWYILYKVFEVIKPMCDLRFVPLKVSYEKITKVYEPLWIAFCKKNDLKYIKTYIKPLNLDIDYLKDYYQARNPKDDIIVHAYKQMNPKPPIISHPPYQIVSSNPMKLRWSPDSFKALLDIKNNVVKKIKYYNHNYFNMSYPDFECVQIICREYFFYLQIQPVEPLARQSDIFHMLTNQVQLYYDYNYTIQNNNLQFYHDDIDEIFAQSLLTKYFIWFDNLCLKVKKKGDLFIPPPPANANDSKACPFRIKFEITDSDTEYYDDNDLMPIVLRGGAKPLTSAQLIKNISDLIGNLQNPQQIVELFQWAYNTYYQQRMLLDENVSPYVEALVMLLYLYYQNDGDANSNAAGIISLPGRNDLWIQLFGRKSKLEDIQDRNWVLWSVLNNIKGAIKTLGTEKKPVNVLTPKMITRTGLEQIYTKLSDDTVYPKIIVSRKIDKERKLIEEEIVDDFEDYLLPESEKERRKKESEMTSAKRMRKSLLEEYPLPPISAITTEDTMEKDINDYCEEYYKQEKQYEQSIEEMKKALFEIFKDDLQNNSIKKFKRLIQKYREASDKLHEYLRELCDKDVSIGKRFKIWKEKRLELKGLEGAVLERMAELQGWYDDQLTQPPPEEKEEGVEYVTPEELKEMEDYCAKFLEAEQGNDEKMEDYKEQLEEVLNPDHPVMKKFMDYYTKFLQKTLRIKRDYLDHMCDTDKPWNERYDWWEMYKNEMDELVQQLQLYMDEIDNWFDVHAEPHLPEEEEMPPSQLFKKKEEPEEPEEKDEFAEFEQEIVEDIEEEEKEMKEFCDEWYEASKLIRKQMNNIERMMVENFGDKLDKSAMWKKWQKKYVNKDYALENKGRVEYKLKDICDPKSSFSKEQKLDLWKQYKTRLLNLRKELEDFREEWWQWWETEGKYEKPKPKPKPKPRMKKEKKEIEEEPLKRWQFNPKREGKFSEKKYITNKLYQKGEDINEYADDDFEDLVPESEIEQIRDPAELLSKTNILERTLISRMKKLEENMQPYKNESVNEKIKQFRIQLVATNIFYIRERWKRLIEEYLKRIYGDEGNDKAFNEAKQSLKHNMSKFFSKYFRLLEDPDAIDKWLKEHQLIGIEEVPQPEQLPSEEYENLDTEEQKQLELEEQERYENFLNENEENIKLNDTLYRENTGTRYLWLNRTWLNFNDNNSIQKLKAILKYWVNTFRINPHGTDNDDVYCYTVFYGDLNSQGMRFVNAVLLKWLEQRFRTIRALYRFHNYNSANNTDIWLNNSTLINNINEINDFIQNPEIPINPNIKDNAIDPSDPELVDMIINHRVGLTICVYYQRGEPLNKVPRNIITREDEKYVEWAPARFSQFKGLEPEGMDIDVPQPLPVEAPSPLLLPEEEEDADIEMPNEEDEFADFDADVMQGIGKYKKGKYSRNVKTGGDWYRISVMDFDTRILGVFNEKQIDEYDGLRSCFLWAVTPQLYSLFDESVANEKSAILNSLITDKMLRKTCIKRIAKYIQCDIKITDITRGPTRWRTLTETKKCKTTPCKKIVYIGLIDNHWFANPPDLKFNITRYAIRNYHKIKDKDKWNLIYTINKKGHVRRKKIGQTLVPLTANEIMKEIVHNKEEISRNITYYTDFLEYVNLLDGQQSVPENNSVAKDLELHESIFTEKNSTEKTKAIPSLGLFNNVYNADNDEKRDIRTSCRMSTSRLVKELRSKKVLYANDNNKRYKELIEEIKELRISEKKESNNYGHEFININVFNKIYNNKKIYEELAILEKDTVYTRKDKNKDFESEISRSLNNLSKNINDNGYQIVSYYKNSDGYIIPKQVCHYKLPNIIRAILCKDLYWELYFKVNIRVKLTAELRTEILEYSVKYLKSHNVIKNNIFSYLFHGLMIYRDHNPQFVIQLHRLNVKLREKYKMEFMIKNYETMPITIDNINDSQDYTPNLEDLESSKSLNSYHMCWFDFETDTQSNVINQHKEYCVAWSLDDGDIECYVGEDCATHLLELIPNKTIMIAHNLNYDCRFLIRNKDVYITNKVNYYNNRFMAGFIKYKNKMIYLKDSYVLLRYPLSKFPSIFNLDYEKEAFPYDLYKCNTMFTGKNYKIKDALDYFDKNHQSDKKNIFLKNIKKLNLIKSDNTFDHLKYAIFYCKQDVRILKEGYNMFRSQILELTKNHCIPLDIDKIISASGVGERYAYNEMVFTGVCKLKNITRGFVHLSVQGGACRSYNNYKLRVSGKTIYYIDHTNIEKILYTQSTPIEIYDFDACSLYPSAMCEMQGIPIGSPKIIEKENLNLNFIKRQTASFVKIKILEVGKHRNMPIMSINIDDKAYFDDRLWKHRVVIVSNIKLKDLIEFHQIKFKILEGLYWDQGLNKHIGRMITKLYNERLEYKKQKNPIQNTIKLIMNSIYGKTLLKPQKYENKFVNNLKEYWNILDSQLDLMNIAYEIEHNKKYRVKIINDMDEHANMVHVGALILDWSKHIMNRVMCLAEDLNMIILYQDTDSMHLNAKDLPLLEKKYREKYNKELIGKNMSQFHSDFDAPKELSEKGYEPRAIETIIVGRKAYYDKIKCNKKGDTADHLRLKGISNEAINKYCRDNKCTPSDIYLKLYKGEAIKFNLATSKIMFQLNTDMTVSTLSKFDRCVEFKCEDVTSLIKG